MTISCRTLTNPFDDPFLKGYVEAALWATRDDSSSEDDYLDANFGIHDLSEAARERMVNDCETFQRENAEALACAYSLYRKASDYTVQEQAGHDFWLTRARSGTGFLDRGLGDFGKKLAEASHKMGDCRITVGDDNKLYFE